MYMLLLFFLAEISCSKLNPLSWLDHSDSHAGLQISQVADMHVQAYGETLGQRLSTCSQLRVILIQPDSSLSNKQSMIRKRQPVVQSQCRVILDYIIKVLELTVLLIRCCFFLVLTVTFLKSLAADPRRAKIEKWSCILVAIPLTGSRVTIPDSRIRQYLTECYKCKSSSTPIR